MFAPLISRVLYKREANFVEALGRFGFSTVYGVNIRVLRFDCNGLRGSVYYLSCQLCLKSPDYAVSHVR